MLARAGRGGFGGFSLGRGSEQVSFWMSQVEALFGGRAAFLMTMIVADSLLENFPVGVWGQRILLPRVQSGGRTLLAEAFGEAGARVSEVAAYESRCPKDLPALTVAALEAGLADAICFSSGKTVRHSAQLLKQRFGENWQTRLEDLKLISIGPQTSATCLAQLGRVDAEADRHDLDGLVAACAEALAQS